MPQQVKSRSGKAGLPPGALVHVGKRFHDTTKITAMDYDADGFTERQIQSMEECRPFKDSPEVTWIDIAGIHDVPLLEELGTLFGLHPLIMEDILNTDQRPKMEDNGDYIYVVLRSFNGTGGIVEGFAEQISIVLGPRFVITLREREGNLLDPIRERIRNGKGRIRKRGTDYLAHAIIDAVVDNYFLVLERIGEDIETIEEWLIGDPNSETLNKIQGLKKETLLMRRSVWPLREVINSLERSESILIRDDT
ncbi:MAG: magnesium and cobalt transport protein CorA, partial [Deltaproteobacteria bacterium]|nr:magnesium and cobalt transport protein CorA [Deltaproteobacteria bacterium]